MPTPPQHRPAALFGLLAAVALAACGGGGGDSPTSPGAPSGPLATAQFPQTATGGDPRGSYTPNEPFLAFFGLPTGYAVNLTRNRGTGTLTITGGSASGGAFTSTINLDVAGTITTPFGPFPLDESDVDGESALDGNGTWRALPNNQIEFRANAEVDTVAYARTAQGFFLVSVDTVAPGQFLRTVAALRSQ